MNKLRTAIIVVMLVLMSSTVYGQFRDTEWGMVRGEVIDAEGVDIYNAIPEGMGYYRTVMGMEQTMTLYIFGEDGLHTGAYEFALDVTPRVLDALTHKYGDPTAIGGQPVWITESTVITMQNLWGPTVVMYLDKSIAETEYGMQLPETGRGNAEQDADSF